MKFLNKISINTSLPLTYLFIVGIIVLNAYFYQIPHRIDALNVTHKNHLKQMSNYLQSTLQNDISHNIVEHSEHRLDLYKINNFNIDFISLYDQKNRHIHITNEDSFVDFEQKFFKDSFLEHRIRAKEENKLLIIEEKAYSPKDEHRYDIRAIVPIRFEFSTPLPLAEHLGTLIIHYNFADEVRSAQAMLWENTLIFILIFTVFYILHAFFIYRSMFKSLHTLRKYVQDYRENKNTEILKFQAEGFKEIVEISNIYITLLKEIERDLIDKNRLNDILQENQNVLALTQKISKMGSCEWRDEQKLWCSDEVYEIFEVEKSFIASLNNLLTIVHEDDREKVAQWFKSHKKGGEIEPLEYRIITASGEERSIVNTSKFVVNVDKSSFKIITSIQDVTVQLQKDLALARYKMAIEQSPLMIIITDKQANIEYVNQAFGDITGYDIKNVIGENINILNSKKQPNEVYQEMWSTLNNKKVWTGELINKKADGELFHTKLTISPLLDDEGELISYVCVDEDITQQREQEEIFRMNNRQAQMGEMISMIAHQWRQPLSAIGAIVNKIKMNTVLGKVHEDELSKEMDKISTKVQFLSNTVDDFRTFFKPNKEKESTTLEAICDKALDVMTDVLEAENIRVFKKYNSVPVSLVTYESELLQVVLNFLKNSYDVFVEKKIDNAFIEISTFLDDSYAVLRVKDNAGGIPEEVINDVFLPYFSTKQKQNGTGLGLYMCKSIIEDHCKGKLLVKNYHEGVRFTIILPLREEINEFPLYYNI